MPDDPVLCERDGPVAVVRLNRPEKHNAINRALSAALANYFLELEADDAIAVIVLTGAGDKAFCAGADMGEQVDRMDGAPAGGNGDVDATDVVARTTKPTIAAINGYAYGGGARLAVSTDIRLASTTAKIRFVGASYGLVVGATPLSRIVGPAHAKELLFTARVIEAAEAERIGLVNHVYEPAALLPAALEMAQQIAANSAPAVRWSKRVVDAATIVEKGLEVDAEADRTLRGSSDHTSRFRQAAERVLKGS